MNVFTRTSTLACVLLGFCACRTLPDLAYPGNDAMGVPPTTAPYRIAGGDRLEIRFPAYPQWNARMLVRDDGIATVPLVGDVPVGGRTLDELREQVEALLRTRIRSPHVELGLAEQHVREVFVAGEVVVPGRITMNGPALTLDQAVFAAGGPRRETARLDSVVLVRTDGAGARRAWRVDLDAALADSAGREPTLLLPGDVVFVPNTRIDELGLFVANYIDALIPAQNIVATTLVLNAAK